MLRLVLVALLFMNAAAFAEPLALDARIEIDALHSDDDAVAQNDVVTAIPNVASCFAGAAKIQIEIEFLNGKVKRATARGSKSAKRDRCVQRLLAKARLPFAKKARVKARIVVEDTTKLLLDSLGSLEAPGRLDRNGADLAAGLGVGTGVSTKPGGSAVVGRPAPSGARVVLGPAQDVPDTHTSDEIERAIKMRAAGYRMCYAKALESRPDLEGKLAYEIRIAENGTVSKAFAKTSAPRSDKLDACVLAQLMRLRFRANGTATIVYPMIFSTP